MEKVREGLAGPVDLEGYAAALTRSGLRPQDVARALVAQVIFHTLRPMLCANLMLTILLWCSLCRGIGTSGFFKENSRSLLLTAMQRWVH